MLVTPIDQRVNEFELKLANRLEKNGITSPKCITSRCTPGNGIISMDMNEWYKCYLEVKNEKEKSDGLTDTFKKLEPRCELEESREKDDIDYKERLHKALPSSTNFDEHYKKCVDNANRHTTKLNIEKNIITETLKTSYCVPGEFFDNFDLKSMDIEKSETSAIQEVFTETANVSLMEQDKSKANVEFDSTFVFPGVSCVRDQKTYRAHGVYISPNNLQEDTIAGFIDSDLTALVELLVPTMSLEKKAEITKLFLKCIIR